MKSFKYAMCCFAALTLLIAGCTKVEDGEEQVKSANSNPFLWQNSAYSISHWSSAQDDVSTAPMPKGTIRVAPENVDFITNSLVNFSVGHMRLSDGKEVAWYGGPSSVGKVRMDGGRFDKLGDYKVPESSAFHLGSDRLKALLADLDAAGRNEADLLKTFRPIFKSGYSVFALYYGIYALLDKDGYFYSNYGTSLYKFGDAEPGNPLSGVKVYGRFDLKKKLPPEIAAGANRVIGINMTFDGHLVIAFSGGIAVTDRDFNHVEYLTFPGEDVENSVAVDSDGGIYLPTSKKMYKFVWTGKRLSKDAADGAWETEYDVADIKIPGVLSKGSGTTPTLIGMGPGEDKLIAISDYGDPAKAVVFWADDIPADFKQRPGTKSRRIADQVALKIDARGTIESSFVGTGNGFVAYNQLPPQPVAGDGPNGFLTSLLVAGFSRPTGSGIEKFVWNKKERRLESQWVDKNVPMTLTVPTYNQPTNTLYVHGVEKGVFGLYGLDWNTGKQVSFIELGASHKFQVFGGIAIPLNEKEFWLTGAFGPVRIRVDEKHQKLTNK